MRRRHALVTGGAGFIGSHLVDRLLEEGWRVTVMDNFDPFYDPAIKERNVAEHLKNERYRLYRLDIRDLSGLRQALTDEYDVIVHLAAKAGVRPSIQDPVTYQEVNVRARRTCWSSPGSGAFAVRLRFFLQRLRSEPERSVAGRRSRVAAHQSVCEHEGEWRASGSRLQPSVRDPLHRAAIFYRLRAETATGSGHSQIRSSHVGGNRFRFTVTARAAGTTPTSMTSSRRAGRHGL